MCFSAEASFGAGVILTTIGVATLKNAGPKKNLLFAAIPFIFGIQQFSEGFLWLSFTHPAWLGWRQPATYVFLFFAQALWPAWVPLSVLRMENYSGRIVFLRIFFILGLVVSVFLASCLVLCKVKASVQGFHIQYDIDIPTYFVKYTSGLYFISTVVPLIISTFRKVRILGFLIFISYLFSQWYFPDHVISVWCYFAAIISMYIFYIVKTSRDALPVSA